MKTRVVVGVLLFPVVLFIVGYGYPAYKQWRDRLGPHEISSLRTLRESTGALTDVLKWERTRMQQPDLTLYDYKELITEYSLMCDRYQLRNSTVGCRLALAEETRLKQRLARLVDDDANPGVR